MERTAINPWSWSLKLGFDQAEHVEGHRRQLVCSGQDAVDTDGNPQHPGDMAAQIELAVDNLTAVLAEADMTLGNVVRLNVYTTDEHASRKGAIGLPEPVRQCRPVLEQLSTRRHAARRTAAPRPPGGNRGRLTRTLAFPSKLIC
jgi:enamine deaminase RidA (YjgF/YER057c/UK114 family)